MQVICVPVVGSMNHRPYLQIAFVFKLTCTRCSTAFAASLVFRDALLAFAPDLDPDPAEQAAGTIAAATAGAYLVSGGGFALRHLDAFAVSRLAQSNIRSALNSVHRPLDAGYSEPINNIYSELNMVIETVTVPS